MKLKKITSFVFLLSALCLKSQFNLVEKNILLPSAKDAFCRDVIALQNGHFLLFGHSADSVANSFESRLNIVEVDSAGNYLWRKYYSEPNWQYFSYNLSPRISLKKGNSLYITSCQQNATGNVRSKLLKTNLAGDTIWTRTFSLGDSSNFNNFSMCFSRDGGLLLADVVVTYSPSFNNHEVFKLNITKVDSNGTVLWTKNTLPPNLNWYQYAYDIVEDRISKQILIAGKISKPNLNPAIFKFDSLGNYLTNIAFDLQSFGSSQNLIIQTQDGYFLSGGYTYLGQQQGQDTYWSNLIKFKPDGTVIFSRTYEEQSPFNNFYRLKESLDSSLLMIGVIDTGFIKHYSINTLVRLMKISKTGEFRWLKYLHNTNSADVIDYPLSFDTGAKNSVLVTNSFYTDYNGRRPFSFFLTDTSTCIFNNANCFSISNVVESNKNSKSTVSPNPARDFVTINNLPFNSKITIETIFGQSMLSVNCDLESITLPIYELPAGIYLVRIGCASQHLSTTKLFITKGD